VENISIMTPATQSTPASSMSSLTQESTKYKKHGVTFDEFIEGNGLDWRNFGDITYDAMNASGYYDLLIKRIHDYFRARTN